ncbi:MAG: PH domain-containing protein [Phycisphaerae bacterium]
MGNQQTETCGNCGATIGKLETPMIWKGSVVCGPCYEKLNRTNKAVRTPVPEAGQREQGQETVLLQGRVSGWPVIIWAVITVIAAIIFWATYLWIIPLAILILIWIRWQTSSYCLTTRKLSMSYGLFRRTHFECRITKINNISRTRGIFGRIFGYGSLDIDTGNSDHQILVHIPNPDAMYDAIQKSMDAAGV